MSSYISIEHYKKKFLVNNYNLPFVRQPIGLNHMIKTLPGIDDDLTQLNLTIHEPIYQMWRTKQNIATGFRYV